MKKETASYLLAKLPIGFSFLGHGIARIPKLQKFSEGLSAAFNETILPYALVKPFAVILPCIELLLGILLLTGYQIKATTVAGVVLICILITGSSLQENWSAIAIQMFYGIYLAGLYFFSGYNKSLFNIKNKTL